MIFATYWFFAFAALVLCLFWLVRNPTARLAVLITASALFHYHFAGSAGVLPIVVLGSVVYFVGLRESKWANGIGIALCVLGLVTYKYSGFVLEGLLGMANGNLGKHLAQVVKTLLPATPPLAISFFTFEFVHYLLDRRKGRPPIKHPAEFVAFSIFFPSLVAGPIKRYEDFLPSLREGLAKVNSRDVMMGLMQISLGFMKKGIADNLTLFIERYDQIFVILPPGLRWKVFVGIAFRILFDFSGYSDIAIGLAKMMGIRLPANFNWPYLAGNIGDFWRRWHISLSTWIRDYIYIALGGNRSGLARKLLNCVIAFALCGLWHGPAWNFVVWGLYHGFGFIVAGGYPKLPFGVGQTLERTFRRYPILSWGLTLMFVWLGWLLFFYPVDTALKMAISLFKLRITVTVS
jgi:alginate O-acetyltransferase complex protein AlgI